MRDVVLYGWLKDRVGRKRLRLAVKSPAEAVRALCALFPGLERELIARDRDGYSYRVYNGREIAERDTLRVTKAEQPIRIIPVLQGAKRGGVLQTLLGAVLIVVGVYFESPALVSAGIGLVLGGVVQMLTPIPKPGDPNEKDANKPSTFFSGPVNTTAQGHPVPLAYGEVICGSAVISAGIATRFVPGNAPVTRGGGGLEEGAYIVRSGIIILPLDLTGWETV